MLQSDIDDEPGGRVTDEDAEYSFIEVLGILLESAGEDVTGENVTVESVVRDMLADVIALVEDSNEDGDGATLR